MSNQSQYMLLVFGVGLALFKATFPSKGFSTHVSSQQEVGERLELLEARLLYGGILQQKGFKSRSQGCNGFQAKVRNIPSSLQKTSKYCRHSEAKCSCHLQTEGLLLIPEAAFTVDQDLLLFCLHGLFPRNEVLRSCLE